MDGKTLWNIIELMLVTFIAGALAGIILVTCSPAPAFAHENAIINCTNNIIYKSVTKLDERRMENGLLDEHYDSNGDEKADIHVLSSLTEETGAESDLSPHVATPIFWIVDLDFDGTVDKIYVDKLGEGNCNDIVLYQDLTIPNEEGMSPDLPPTQRPREADRRHI